MYNTDTNFDNIIWSYVYMDLLTMMQYALSGFRMTQCLID